jgi:hypothetical protein
MNSIAESGGTDGRIRTASGEADKAELFDIEIVD